MNFLSRFAQCIDNIPYRPLRYLTLLVTLAVPIIFGGLLLTVADITSTADFSLGLLANCFGLAFGLLLGIGISFFHNNQNR